ncbi:GntR family transcriptional regulator [Fusibacter paucivorans]|uniref:GntR family transcriptional regulator n=1 Tax=Fusibacter paucivorans TaxID=76009 RepID=A0ABS5PLQ1_9FIRM|nr:GntR family transcriptional regulator [Fusibacter paucivorans]MBS7525276.1 GntR family transcriptional regulator [Fusibacter paucivorans]
MIEKQTTYKYKVYEQIKEDIITGVYSQGEILNERRLSDVLGISRTPIREALQLLHRDGWVVYEVYKGAVVRTFEIEYFTNVQKVRRALEVLAIEDAILNATDTDIKELNDIVQLQETALKNDDTIEFMNLDRSLHNKISLLSKNEVLLNLLKNINDIIRFLGLKVLAKGARKKATLIEHKAIVKAIESRNLEDAKKAMETHMIKTGEAISNFTNRK